MISVVIPTYNRSKVISRAIESVIAQTFKNWEIVVVDDGSEDNTEALVKNYIDQDSRISYYYQDNRGAGAARNAGVGYSKYEIIAFLDSDDIWTVGRLNLILNHYQGKGNLNSVVFTDFKSQNCESTAFKRKLLENYFFFQNLLAINILGGASNLVVPKKIFNEVNGFDPKLTSTEDHELYIRLAEQFPITYLSGEFAINYRNTHNRLSGNSPRRLSGQLDYYHKHKAKMSLLSKLLVMKKNAILAYYIKSPILLRYLPAWLIVKILHAKYKIDDENELFVIQSKFLDYLRKKRL